MIHLDDGVLRAWLDREIAPDTGRDVHAHVDVCDACRARVRELRRAEEVVRSALSVLDGPTPHQSAWIGVAAGLADPTPGGSGSAGRKHRPTTPPAGWARAAGFVLLLGGGLAAAVVPGSPLRSLWAPATDPAAEPAPNTVAAESAPTEAGVRAARAGAPLRIELQAPAGTFVDVVLAGERAGVFGPASSSFSTGEGWLRAELPGGPVRVELPAVHATARIEVNGAPVVTFEEGRITHAPDDAVRNEGDVRLRFRVR